MKKILLLNPPGKKLYIREYFCSKVSQADNLLHPIDLVLLSGILAQEYDVSLIDAIVNKMSPEDVLAKIGELQPFAIVSLFGAVSLEEDLDWTARLKQALPQVKIIGIGDIFLEDGQKWLEKCHQLDAILLDFTTDDILAYLKGGAQTEVVNMIVRGENAEVRSSEKRNDRTGHFEIPVPRHELFLKYPYRHSMIRGSKFVTTVIDYGCPFPCSFCIMNTLGYKVRSLDNIVAELKHIRQLGIKEVFFHTQTFGANKKLCEELCEEMIREKLDFGWVCFSRVDVATPKFLNLLKRAGCHSIIFGVESGSNQMMELYNKQYTVEQVMQTIDHCSEIGIETSGTFILGLPDESHSTIRDTLRLLKKIKLDYAGINVAVPRAGTKLREQAIESKLIKGDCQTMDQSGTTICMATKYLTKEDIEKYRRRAISTFYFRLGYIFRRIRRMRARDAVKIVKNAVRLIKSTWF
jgi:radical SAM superfamily enzyme YgiQ (UPF0313 family)